VAAIGEPPAAHASTVTGGIGRAARSG